MLGLRAGLRVRPSWAAVSATAEGFAAVLQSRHPPQLAAWRTSSTGVLQTPAPPALCKRSGHNDSAETLSRRGKHLQAESLTAGGPARSPCLCPASAADLQVWKGGRQGGHQDHLPAWPGHQGAPCHNECAIFTMPAHPVHCAAGMVQGDHLVRVSTEEVTQTKKGLTACSRQRQQDFLVACVYPPMFWNPTCPGDRRAPPSARMKTGRQAAGTPAAGVAARRCRRVVPCAAPCWGAPHWPLHHQRSCLARPLRSQSAAPLTDRHQQHVRALFYGPAFGSTSVCIASVHMLSRNRQFMAGSAKQRSTWGAPRL